MRAVILKHSFTDASYRTWLAEEMNLLSVWNNRGSKENYLKPVNSKHHLLIAPLQIFEFGPSFSHILFDHLGFLENLSHHQVYFHVIPEMYENITLSNICMYFFKF